MLEQNEHEHTSEETEHELNTENNTEEQLKGNNNTAQQDSGLPDDIGSRSPCPSDEQEESIYIVSSGEDSNHAYNDENEDEYTDSEEEEDEEDNEMSDPLKIYNYDNEDDETEYEHDSFDRASDDFVLNNRLRHSYKERSWSLQDLNVSKHNLHSPQKKKWRNYLNLQLNKNTFREAYSAMYKRRIISHKNDYMDNKVMNYLRHVREQNRNVRNECMKGQELIINKIGGNDTEQVKIKVRNAAENYAENKRDSRQEEIVDSNLNQDTSQVFENKTSNGIIKDRYERTRERYIEIDDNAYNEKGTRNCDSDTDIEKQNGSLDKSEEMDAQTIEDGNASSLKIMSIKNIVASDKSENVNCTRSKTVDRLNSEIAELNAQLRQFHQKAETEDVKMKQELDSLKKSLAKYEDTSKTCETRNTLQTAMIVKASDQDTLISGERNNAISVICTDHEVENSYNPVTSTKLRGINSNVNPDNGNISKGTVSSVLRTCIMSHPPCSETKTNVTQFKTRIEDPSVSSINKELTRNVQDQLGQDQLSRTNSTVAVSNPNKRKAMEMIDDSCFVQTSKLARTERNNIDAIDAQFKYPEVYTNPKVKQEINNTSVNRGLVDGSALENTMEHAEDNENNLKCFIYRDNGNSKNRSFLIQTEEPITDRLESEKNRIEECGPYLLGNLEVRMSKMNGVINVWGKEIDDELESDSEDDTEISVNPSEKNVMCCCQNTCQSRFNGGSLAHSAGQKRTVSRRFDRFDHCCHSSLKSSTFVNDTRNDQSGKYCFSSTTCYGNCDSSHCRQHEWPMNEDAMDLQEQVHSCCIYRTEAINKTCARSSYEKLTFDVNCKCCRDKFRSVQVQKHACDKGCSAKSSFNTIWDKCNQNISHQDEQVPTISRKRANETAQRRQRRLKRKRVQGVIKGLLEEYGDCHENGVANVLGGETKDSVCIVNDRPQTKISPTNESVCITSVQSTNSCRYSRARALSLGSEIGELQRGMDRIESRLDTISRMLNKVLYVDTSN